MLSRIKDGHTVNGQHECYAYRQNVKLVFLSSAATPTPRRGAEPTKLNSFISFRSLTKDTRLIQ